MVAHTETFPDYTAIDTPWEPEPIVWRYTTPDATFKSVTSHEERNFFALKAATDNPDVTHIVREVEVMTHPSLPSMFRPVHEIVSSLVEIDWQFQQFEDLTDLKVPRRQWHVFSDGHGRTRTLARVEVVEGNDLIAPFSKESDADAETRAIIRDIKRQVASYRNQAVGRPLFDIEFARQYRRGIPRTEAANPLAVQALYMVDIEPVTYDLT